MPDGGAFDAFCAVPDPGDGPGLLLFQEIFGINDNMRVLAGRLAAAGFVTLVPDMYWRIEPRFERQGEAGMADAFAIRQRFDPVSATVRVDIEATFTHLLAMPECTGKVGGAGFCLGGTLAFLFAATPRVNGRGPDAIVSYYGSGVHGLLDLAPRIECPVMFHYGTRDPYITHEQIATVEKAMSGRPGAVFHRYPAGHAFSNWDVPSMYDKDSADLAWDRTLRFLTEHLPPSLPA